METTISGRINRHIPFVVFDPFCLEYGLDIEDVINIFDDEESSTLIVEEDTITCYDDQFDKYNDKFHYIIRRENDDLWIREELLYTQVIDDTIISKTSDIYVIRSYYDDVRIYDDKIHSVSESEVVNVFVTSDISSYSISTSNGFHLSEISEDDVKFNSRDELEMVKKIRLKMTI